VQSAESLLTLLVAGFKLLPAWLILHPEDEGDVPL
jgi:hypothetical protein